MGLLRRLVGAVVLLLSAAGIVFCVAGIVGTWMMRQAVSERVQGVADRLDTALQQVSAANQHVRLALEKARADVAEVDRESAGLGGGGMKSRVAARTIRTLIQQQVGPDIDELGGRLATLSDSAVAVSSLLQTAQEIPLAQVPQIDPDQLKRRADEAQRLASVLRRLEVAVGKDNESSRQEVATTTSKVDLALEKCQATVDAWQANLDGVGDELARVRTKVLGWLTWAAVAVTALCSWVGAGQVSLFARALRWCGGGRRNDQ